MTYVPRITINEKSVTYIIFDVPKDTDHKCLHQQFIKYRKKSNVGTSKNTDKGEREKKQFQSVLRYTEMQICYKFD